MILSKYQKSLYYEICINQEYQLLNTDIKSAKTVFDIGSNIGLFSLYVLSQKLEFMPVLLNSWQLNFPKKEAKTEFMIHLFEPSEETYSLSKKILEPYEKYVTINQTGILGQETKKELIIPEIDAQTSIYSSFLTKKTINSKWAEFTTLSAYLWEKGVEQIDVMKVDVEGSEFDIFLSLGQEVFQKIHVLFLEYHLLNKEFEELFPKLVENLQKHFKTVTIIEGKYTLKIGYILCKK